MFSQHSWKRFGSRGIPFENPQYYPYTPREDVDSSLAGRLSCRIVGVNFISNYVMLTRIEMFEIHGTALELGVYFRTPLILFSIYLMSATVIKRLVGVDFISELCHVDSK